MDIVKFKKEIKKMFVKGKKYILKNKLLTFIMSLAVLFAIISFVLILLVLGKMSLKKEPINYNDKHVIVEEFKLESLSIDETEVTIVDNKDTYIFWSKKAVLKDSIKIDAKEDIDVTILGDAILEDGDMVAVILNNKNNDTFSYIIEINIIESNIKCPLISADEATNNYCTQNIEINGKNYVLEAKYTGNFDEATDRGEVEVSFNNNSIIKYYENPGDEGNLSVGDPTVLKDAVFMYIGESSNSSINRVVGATADRVFLNTMEVDSTKLEYFINPTNQVYIVGNKAYINFNHIDLLDGANKDKLCLESRNMPLSGTYSFIYYGSGNYSKLKLDEYKTLENYIDSKDITCN